MSTSQTDRREQTDDRGAIERLEARPYVGVLARYWRAAAYDHHDERTTDEWLKIASYALGVAIAMMVPFLVATAIAATNPTLLPAESTLAYAALDTVVAFYRAVWNVPMTLALIYVFKIVAVEIDAELEERGADG